MFCPINKKQFNKDYREGVEKGFDIAESYLKDVAKDFYKAMKKGLLSGKATTTLINSHKCNCEFCHLDEK